MSTESSLREINGTIAERIFFWLAETDETPSPPQVAKALVLPELATQTACRLLEELGLVDFDGSLAATMHLSMQGQAAAKRLLAERASGKSRRSALRTALLNWLSDIAPQRVDSMADFALTPSATLHGTPFTDQDIVGETVFLEHKGLVQGQRSYDSRHLTGACLTANGRDCVDRLDSDVNAWLSRLEQGTVTHNETTFNNSPHSQSMNGSPGGRQTATVTISHDNRRQLLQIADQIADQIAGLPAGIAPAATAGVEELRQAANDNSADVRRVKAVLGKIAVDVAVAVGTDAGQAILGLISQAAQSLGS
jgi:hypothetical protein